MRRTVGFLLGVFGTLLIWGVGATEGAGQILWPATPFVLAIASAMIGEGYRMFHEGGTAA